MRKAITVAVFLGSFLHAWNATHAENPRDAKPNIIFVFSDDHAFQAISAYGSRINKTPNLDKLASQGMRFDRCLVTNSICGPSRAVILTGKYSHLNGFRQNGNQFDGSQQTFPKLLQKAGYQTAIFGKWHLRTEPTGFDKWIVLPGQGHYYNPDFKTPDGDVRIEGYVTDIVTENALEWLQNDRDKDKPFMLMIQNKAPHREWNPGPGQLDAYRNEDITEPETLFDDYSNRAPVLLEQTMTITNHMRMGWDLKLWTDADKGTRPYERFFGRMTAQQRDDWDKAYEAENAAFIADPPEGDDLVRWKYQRYIKDYLRCIDSVDENIGKVMTYLEQSGLDENTVLIYSSDQGFYLGEHGWYDKRWIFEESLRTPLIVRWPGVTDAGTTCDRMVSNLDFAETFLEMADVDVPGDMQGQSLVPILKGEEPDDWRSEFYYHYYELGTHNVAAHYGIVTDRFKLVNYYARRADGERHEIDQWDLMDREADPLEVRSYYADPRYAEIRQELTERLAKLREKLQVPEED